MYKVLVANRDGYDTKGIEWLLHSSMAAVQVDTAITKKDMINKLESFQPNLLIVELDMVEEQDYQEFFKTIKIIQPAIVALTMEATYSQAKKAIDIGVVDLLLKPISPEILLKAIQKLFRQHQSSNKDNTKSTSYQNQLIQYEQLFIEQEQGADPYIFIGIKAENTNELSRLYEFLQEYPFKYETQFFILSDIIILISNESDKHWKEEASRLMRDWLENYKIAIAIAIHNGDRGKGSVRKHYLETKQLMERTFYVGYKQIIDHSTSNNWRFIDPFLTPGEQKMWIDFLNQSDKEGIKSWLYEEFLQFTEPYPDPGLIRIRLTSILAQIRRHMKTFHLTDEQFEGEYLKLFQSILYSPVIYNIIKELVLFVSSILEVIKKDKGLHLDLIDRVIHFIEVNYWDSNINLEKVAEYVERNPSYLSSYISKKCAKTFRELLNEIRIKAAQKLLIETDMSIKEISHLCGFNNQQYFNKVFHKMRNTPPNLFRKNKKSKYVASNLGEG